MEKLQVPEPYYVVFAKPGDTLSAIVRDTLGPFSRHSQWMEAVAQVAKQSSIANPDRIYPDQPVALRSASASGFCPDPVSRRELEQLRSIWRATPPGERELVEKHWDLLNWANAGNNAIGGLAGAGQAVALAGQKSLTPPPPQLELILRERLRLFRHELIRVRQGTVTILIREGFVQSKRTVVRLVPNRASQAHYANQLRSLTTTARSLKWTGRGSIGVSVGLAAYNVYQDWGTARRYRTLTGQVAGVGLAALGGAAGYWTCTVGLGVPTGGHSVWICALALGAVSGAALGEIGTFTGEWVYDQVTPLKSSDFSRHSENRSFVLDRQPLPALR